MQVFSSTERNTFSIGQDAAFSLIYVRDGSAKDQVAGGVTDLSTLFLVSTIPFYSCDTLIKSDTQAPGLLFLLQLCAYVNFNYFYASVKNSTRTLITVTTVTAWQSVHLHNMSSIHRHSQCLTLLPQRPLLLQMGSFPGLLLICFMASRIFPLFLSQKVCYYIQKNNDIFVCWFGMLLFY